MSLSKVALPSGAVVAYEDSGGKGVPIIFSHGLFMDHAMFVPQVARFAPERRCISWDERGHGETVWNGGAFTYWDSARDLLALMDALGIERAIHVGMSQGGLLGMRAAILAPERFVGIVQLATQAGKLDDEGIAGFRVITDDWIANGVKPETLDFLRDLILGPGVDTAYWYDWWSRMTPQQVTDALSALFSIDELYDRLHEVKVPLCTIHGLADVATPHPLAERVHAAVPDPRGITLIPNGPHAVNLSDPDAVNAAIAAFVDELARADPSIRG